MPRSRIVEARPVLERPEIPVQVPPSNDDSPLIDLYSRYASWLVVALRRRFGRDVAEDLAQDVYARLSARPPDGDIRQPKAYLMTVAAHLAIDAERKRRREVPLEPVVSFEDWASGEAASQIEYLALKEAILTMSRPLREAFMLSRFRGLTNQAIAEELGISVKAVEWRISRALEHCAERMRD